MQRILEIDQAVAQMVLDEELSCVDVVVDGHSLREIFEEIAASPSLGRGLWRHLAERLGYADVDGVKRLVREELPRILAGRPRLLHALAAAAGASMDVIGKKKEGTVPYTQTSEERRVDLLRQFDQEFGQAMTEMEPGEVAIEITGSPHSIVLANLVTRYYHGRFKPLVLFSQLPTEPVEGLDQYLEEYRLYYGMDPLTIHTPETLAAFQADGEPGFWREATQLLKGRDKVRMVVCAVARKDLAANGAEAFEAGGLKVASMLDEWTPDDVYTYLDQHQLTAFDPFTVTLFAERKAAEKKVDRERYKKLAREYTIDDEGRYVRNGVVIAEQLLPEELKETIQALAKGKNGKAAADAKKEAAGKSGDEEEGDAGDGGESADVTAAAGGVG
jgi:hypothetical protein